MGRSRLVVSKAGSAELEKLTNVHFALPTIPLTVDSQLVGDVSQRASLVHSLLRQDLVNRRPDLGRQRVEGPHMCKAFAVAPWYLSLRSPGICQSVRLLGSIRSSRVLVDVLVQRPSPRRRAVLIILRTSLEFTRR
jgi:hypothetical protein